ncbi:hypothetical protein TURU_112082 [Turdus rufiventris]|nr:hypothetical protein TURU_112082 [Turdus rufiventris]
MVSNALWGWLEQWKQKNWQHRGKHIWADTLWKDIAAQVKNLFVKVRHIDAHVPKSEVPEEHQNQQVDHAAGIEVAQVDLDWQHKGELFLAQWAHDTSGYQGRDATYRWACDRGVDLTVDTITQVIQLTLQSIGYHLRVSIKTVEEAYSSRPDLKDVPDWELYTDERNLV